MQRQGSPQQTATPLIVTVRDQPVVEYSENVASSSPSGEFISDNVPGLCQDSGVCGL
jgi:hypothetical protein